MAGGPRLVDLHSHLVPAVDDGSRSIDDSLEGLTRMWEAGIGRVITTPHLDGSLTRTPGAVGPTLAAVDIAFRDLAVAARERLPDLVLERGHEVMLDVPDPDLSDPRLRLADTSFVLVEWPRLMLPPGTVDAVARLRATGVRPVIAHPERYRGMAERFRLAEIWRQEGAILQVNYGSLVGRYGAGPRSLAFRLLIAGWVDCLSTDFHGRPHLELHVSRAQALFEERDAVEQFDLLAVTNTGRIAEGKDPLPVPPLRPQRRLWSRLKGLLRTE